MISLNFLNSIVPSLYCFFQSSLLGNILSIASLLLTYASFRKIKRVQKQIDERAAKKVLDEDMEKSIDPLTKAYSSITNAHTILELLQIKDLCYAALCDLSNNKIFSYDSPSKFCSLSAFITEWDTLASKKDDQDSLIGEQYKTKYTQELSAIIHEIKLRRK